jgi:hypothetical protein
MAKRIVRLTESDLHRIVKNAANRVLREAYLNKDDYRLEDEFRDNYDWGKVMDNYFDEDFYRDYDPYEDINEPFDDHDPTDNELYHYGQW